MGLLRNQNNRGWTALRRGGASNETMYVKSTPRDEAVARLWLALHPMNETDQGENRPTA